MGEKYKLSYFLYKKLKIKNVIITIEINKNINNL